VKQVGEGEYILVKAPFGHQQSYKSKH